MSFRMATTMILRHGPRRGSCTLVFVALICLINAGCPVSAVRFRPVQGNFTSELRSLLQSTDSGLSLTDLDSIFRNCSLLDAPLPSLNDSSLMCLAHNFNTRLSIDSSNETDQWLYAQLQARDPQLYGLFVARDEQMQQIRDQELVQLLQALAAPLIPPPPPPPPPFPSPPTMPNLFPGNPDGPTDSTPPLSPSIPAYPSSPPSPPRYPHPAEPPKPPQAPNPPFLPTAPYRFQFSPPGIFVPAASFEQLQSQSHEKLQWYMVVVPLIVVLAVVGLLFRLRHARLVHHTAFGKVLPPQGLPGTALLLTDIENSTSLWESLPEGIMDSCISMHHACLRGVALKHSGYESATEGDAFTFAFHNSTLALLFAVEAQAALLELPWPLELLALPGLGEQRVASIGDGVVASVAALPYVVPELLSRGRQQLPRDHWSFSQQTAEGGLLWRLLSCSCWDSIPAQKIPSTRGMYSTYLKRWPTGTPARNSMYSNQYDGSLDPYAAPQSSNTAQDVEGGSRDASGDLPMDKRFLENLFSAPLFMGRTRGTPPGKRGLPPIPTVTIVNENHSNNVLHTVTGNSSNVAGMNTLTLKAALRERLKLLQPQQDAARHMLPGACSDSAQLNPQLSNSGRRSGPLKHQANAEGLLIFRGLRVRMGISAGRLSPADVQHSRTAGRTQYGGLAMTYAKDLTDCAQGGMVLLDSLAFKDLNLQRVEQSAIVMHMGDHVISEADTQSDSIYQAFGLSCLPRLQFLGPVRSVSETHLGVLDAPVEATVAAFMHMVDCSLLLAWNMELGTQAISIYQSVAQRLLYRHHGYCVMGSNNLVLAAFTCPVEALSWSLEVVEELKHAEWPAELLELTYCEPIIISQPVRRTRELTRRGSGSDLSVADSPRSLEAASALHMRRPPELPTWPNSADALVAADASLPQQQSPPSLPQQHSPALLPQQYSPPTSTQPHSAALLPQQYSPPTSTQPHSAALLPQQYSPPTSTQPHSAALLPQQYSPQTSTQPHSAALLPQQYSPPTSTQPHSAALLPQQYSPPTSTQQCSPPALQQCSPTPLPQYSMPPLLHLPVQPARSQSSHVSWDVSGPASASAAGQISPQLSRLVLPSPRSSASFSTPTRSARMAPRVVHHVSTLQKPKPGLVSSSSGYCPSPSAASGSPLVASSFDRNVRSSSRFQQQANPITGAPSPNSAQCTEIRLLTSSMAPSVVAEPVILFRGPRMKAGIDCGQVHARLDPVTCRIDYFGRVMNRGARITAKASSGMVWCSSEVWHRASIRQENMAREATRGFVLVAESVGAHRLKGISGEVELMQARWERSEEADSGY